MILTLATTHRPATDLGFLLMKHPGRAHPFQTSVGPGIVVFPEATEERCEAALLVEADPVALVRGAGATAEAYVNDRPYAASSHLSVALAEAFGTAMNGRSRERPELAASAIPLEASLPVVPARGGAGLVHRLFEPLGYAVETTPLEAGPYVSLRLTGTVRLADLLSHLYVLLPVLDERKHYFVDEREIEKLLRRGEGWLEGHPERETIVRSSLRRGRGMADEALARLGVVPEPRAPREPRLHDLRLDTLAERLAASGAKEVLDLGCGEGALLKRLRKGPFTRIVGVDPDLDALDRANRALKLDEGRDAGRITLLQGAATLPDRRLTGFDAAVLSEVVEHTDPDRLPDLETAVFRDAHPRTVFVTTPNREHNPVYGLAEGQLRHPDHRFEFTREEFRAWAEGIGERRGYAVEIEGLGEVHETAGAPSQMAVFRCV